MTFREAKALACSQSKEYYEQKSECLTGVSHPNKVPHFVGLLRLCPGCRCPGCGGNRAWPAPCRLATRERVYHSLRTEVLRDQFARRVSHFDALPERSGKLARKQTDHRTVPSRSSHRPPGSHAGHLSGECPHRGRTGRFGRWKKIPLACDRHRLR